jgi:outer membrane protein insertion porin family
MGLSFNNFSARNLIRKRINLYLWVMVKRYLYDYKRVHFSDLQRFVFRTVVWTKKPVQFSSSISYSKQFLNDFTYSKGRQFQPYSFSRFARRLTVPDDFFVLSQSVSYQHYDLNNYNTGLFTFGNGASKFSLHYWVIKKQ